jgi:hypothetical protein
MQGADFLNHFVLPNFYFHLTREGARQLRSSSAGWRATSSAACRPQDRSDAGCRGRSLGSQGRRGEGAECLPPPQPRNDLLGDDLDLVGAVLVGDEDDLLDADIELRLELLESSSRLCSRRSSGIGCLHERVASWPGVGSRCRLTGSLQRADETWSERGALGKAGPLVRETSYRLPTMWK